MPERFTRKSAAAGLRGVAALVVLLLAPAQILARPYNVGALHIDQPWLKPTPNAAPTAAGYLTVTNHGKTADRLLGGSSPLAQAIEPHAMTMTGAVMRMRLLPQGFEIAPGATLTLAPGGGHLMLIGPRRPFKVGDEIPATLRFARAGEVRVDFTVQTQAPTSGGSMPGMDMH